jgi:hypothetical protein
MKNKNKTKLELIDPININKTNKKIISSMLTDLLEENNKGDITCAIIITKNIEGDVYINHNPITGSDLLYLSTVLYKTAISAI